MYIIIFFMSTRNSNRYIVIITSKWFIKQQYCNLEEASNSSSIGWHYSNIQQTIVRLFRKLLFLKLGIQWVDGETEGYYLIIDKSIHETNDFYICSSLQSFLS